MRVLLRQLPTADCSKHCQCQREESEHYCKSYARPLSPSSSSTIHARCSRVHVSCFNANSFAAYYYYYSKSLERWRTSCCPPFTKRKCVKWKLQNALTEFPLVVLHCKHLISSCPCVFTGCIVLTSYCNGHTMRKPCDNVIVCTFMWGCMPLFALCAGVMIASVLATNIIQVKFLPVVFDRAFKIFSRVR